MNMRHRRVFLKGRKRPIVFKHKETIDPKVADFLNIWVTDMAKMIEEQPPQSKPSKAALRYDRNVEKAFLRDMHKRDPSYAEEFEQRGQWKRETADIV